MGKYDRQKASDVFNQIDFFLAKKTSFEKAFPQIEKIKVEVIESGEGINDWNEKRTYSNNDMGEYINCHNRRCYNGGFCMGQIIRQMTYEKKTELETTELCQGYEGSPKGRKKYGMCTNFFEIKVVIKYKDELQINEP